MMRGEGGCLKICEASECCILVIVVVVICVIVFMWCHHIYGHRCCFLRPVQREGMIIQELHNRCPGILVVVVVVICVIVFM